MRGRYPPAPFQRFLSYRYFLLQSVIDRLHDFRISGIGATSTMHDAERVRWRSCGCREVEYVIYGVDGVCVSTQVPRSSRDIALSNII